MLMERAAGIEPASSAWKAEVIAIIPCPLCVKIDYTLSVKTIIELLNTKKKGLNMKQKENYEIFSVNIFRFCALLF